MNLSIQQFNVQFKNEDEVTLSVILIGESGFLVTVAIEVSTNGFKDLSIADIERQAIAKAKENLNFC